jgi:hypothetical protein
VDPIQGDGDRTAARLEDALVVVTLAQVADRIGEAPIDACAYRHPSAERGGSDELEGVGHAFTIRSCVMRTTSSVERSSIDDIVFPEPLDRATVLLSSHMGGDVSALVQGRSNLDPPPGQCWCSLSDART